MKSTLEPVKFIATDIFGSVIYFPVWWYTVGAWNVIELLLQELRGFAQGYNLKVLFQFLLTPMFGQYDIEGRIISFFVRIVHFFVLTIFTLCYSIILLFLLAAWLLLPVFVVANILFQLGMITLYA